jgi:hypothetical protein
MAGVTVTVKKGQHGPDEGTIRVRGMLVPFNGKVYRDGGLNVSAASSNSKKGGRWQQCPG